MGWTSKPLKLALVKERPPGSMTMAEAETAWGVHRNNIRRWIQEERVDAVRMEMGAMEFILVTSTSKPEPKKRRGNPSPWNSRKNKKLGRK